MAWMELRFNATHEAVDWVRTLLTPDGLQPVGDHRFSGDIQVLAPQTPDNRAPWPCTICLSLPNETAAGKIVELLHPLQRTQMIGEIDAETVTEPSPIFHRIRPLIGQKFIILDADDSGENLDPDRRPLRLKSSLAFGSGLHPATILSLELLERWITPGMTVLDLGCGSGILSVVIAHLGATVVAIDNDPIAIAATQDAVERNGVQSQVSVMAGSLGRGSDLGHWMGGTATIAPPIAHPPFDAIAANILARMHVAIAPDYPIALKPGGILISAGFTDDYQPEVDAAFAQVGLTAVDTARSHEWIALAHRLCD